MAGGRAAVSPQIVRSMRSLWALRVVIAGSVLPQAIAHCTPESSCWPSLSQWDSLRSKLTGGLHPLKADDLNLTACDVTDAQQFYGTPFPLRADQTGICTFNLNCYSENCSGIPWTGFSGGLVPNIPSYAVSAASVDDIIVALGFAREHSIAVTVRVHGHSYTGSSTGRGTLLIWLANFPSSKPAIEEDFVDTCGKHRGPVMKIAGGHSWREAYLVASEDGRFDIGGGYCPSVAASGGWLMGGGLSSQFHRMNGLGVDNVLQFEVVLANGSFVKADPCSHPQLFWALRGGGGGTFGIVTAAYHRLHPAKPVVFAIMSLGSNYSAELQEAWGDFWAKESPHLDRRWGGGFSGNMFSGVFHGSADDANVTFVNKVNQWRESLPKELGPEKIRGGVYGPYPNYLKILTGTQKWFPASYWAPNKATNHSSWLIPHDWVVNNPGLAKQLITDSIDSDTYWVGGAIMDVAEDATSVNPALRKAVWNIITANRTYANWLRKLLPESGSEYNHASPMEPNYKHAFWGKNYDKLAEIKRFYDPEGLFDCKNCVQLEPALKSGAQVISSPDRQIVV